MTATGVLISLQDAAERMGYKSWRSIKRRAREGRLPFEILRDGKRLVVRSADLAAFFAGLRPVITPEDPSLSQVDREIVEAALSHLNKPQRGGAWTTIAVKTATGPGYQL